MFSNILYGDIFVKTPSSELKLHYYDLRGCFVLFGPDLFMTREQLHPIR